MGWHMDNSFSKIAISKIFACGVGKNIYQNKNSIYSGNW